MRNARFALIIPGTLLAAAIVVRAVLTHAPARLAPAIAQPLAVVTNWNAFGAVLLVILALGLAAATWAYLRVLRLRSAQDDTLSPLVLCALCALALACAWCVPVLFSSDVYAYAAYGEMARLGAGAYAHATLPAGNPIFDAAIWQWGNPPPACVYGPAFVWLADWIVTLAAPLGTLAQLDALRAISSAALVLCCLLAYAAYPGDRRARATAAAFIGLNPVAIWCAAEGHNDAIALAVALGGFALARRGSIGLGAAVVALSGLVKLPGIAAAIVFAVPNRRAQAGTIAGVAITAALSVPLFEGVTTRVAPHAHYAPLASFQGIVEPLARLFAGERPASIATMLIAAAVAVAIAARAVARVRSGHADGWIYLALAGWLLIPNPYPWYGLWLIAIAALAPHARAARVAIVLSLASLLRYAPDAIAAPSMPAALALSIAAALPLLGLGYASDDR